MTTLNDDFGVFCHLRWLIVAAILSTLFAVATALRTFWLIVVTFPQHHCDFHLRCHLCRSRRRCCSHQLLPDAASASTTAAAVGAEPTATSYHVATSDAAPGPNVTLATAARISALWAAMPPSLARLRRHHRLLRLRLLHK